MPTATASPTRTTTITLFFTLLLLTNRHLFSGEPPAAFAYQQAAVVSGEWWRLVTHPLTHVSWYHLALDTVATMLLWAVLPLSGARKLVVATASGVASLALAVTASPLIAEYGLCGLSGIAHGLMTATGLLLLARPRSANSRGNLPAGLIGALLFTAAMGKSLFEALAGTPLFLEMHAANLGIPIVHAHLGGCLGGIIALVGLPTTKDATLQQPAKP